MVRTSVLDFWTASVDTDTSSLLSRPLNRRASNPHFCRFLMLTVLNSTQRSAGQTQSQMSQTNGLASFMGSMKLYVRLLLLPRLLF